jgi:SprT protein
MPAPLRKAYEVHEEEVSQFFASGARELLTAPLEAFPPEHHYLIKIYRNAYGFARKRKRAEALAAVQRFHLSIRVELSKAPPDLRELKQKAFARLHQLCLQHQVPHPELNFRLRGSTGGTATDEWISLNVILFRENPAEYINQVIPHELCHVWKRRLKLPGDAHGKHWQGLMRKMGVPPVPCHSMDVTNTRVVTKRIHGYRCKCERLLHVTPAQHADIMRSREPYRCRRCKQPVVYAGLDYSLIVESAT